VSDQDKAVLVEFFRLLDELDRQRQAAPSRPEGQ
jgi:hypothetical protein